MKEKYKEDTIEYGPIDLPWNNLFEFEVKVTVATLVQGLKAVVLNQKKNTFYDTYQFQQFALRDPLIQYILKHANHRVLRKLFASCKYFFAKRQTPLCYSLVKKEGTKFDDENLKLDYLADPNLFLKNTYVTGCLFADLCAWGNSQAVLMHRRFVSIVIPRLYRCEARYIHLTDQDLTFKELQFLIEHGGVVDFRSEDCEIVDEDDEYIHLEKYMEYLPSVERLLLRPTYVNANTGRALAELKFSSKATFKFISFEPIYGDPFDAKEFIKFCDAIRGESILMDMDFDDDDFNEAFVESFKEIMRNYQNNTNNGSFNISRVGDDDN
uniref:Uncharacterized protein n=1 Tax=Panagrolaimus davidi TaxID=227884 RepID=A0A914Q1U7_9BILA